MAEWIETKVTFKSTDPKLVTDLIADAFYESGLKGVVLDDPQLMPEEGWGNDAVGPADRYAVTGYFSDTPQALKKSRLLASKLAALSKNVGFTYDLEIRRINEEEWAESWKTFFWPEHITDRIVVKPTWREYRPGPDEVVLEIDPGMAFGTGTHPTTAMCVHQIETYLENGASFLDVGTGSGILMLAAARMGAKRMLGIDNDEIAVRVAAENMQLNRIDPESYGLHVGNLAESVDGCFGFVTANILFGVIMKLLGTIHNYVENNGILVCSGIVSRNEKAVTDKMVSKGYEILEVMTREEWVCIAARYVDRHSKGIHTVDTWQKM